MKLSTSQLKQLRALRAQRESSPTILGYLKATWRATALLSTLCISAAAIYYWAGWFLPGGFFVGVLFGVLVRDAGWYRRLVRNWPVSKEITDWSRVDELIDRNS